MVLWQSDLRISWRAQWISLLLHGVVAAMILLMPWPLRYTPLWLLLLTLVVFDCVRSQRRIRACQGAIKLLANSCLYWKTMEWQIIGTPWMIKSGILFHLRDPQTQTRRRLWIAADSMSIKEWRDLRRLIGQATSPPLS
ncbi:protein YgfX [Enterobacteriaceae bacterium ESL0689]|nr:protein YgfX [Enterobacteriaceae bacterium ESL0689]